MDLHTIPGFSESVIYFNDIESDPQYDELVNSVQAFFDKSKFGELPEIKPKLVRDHIRYRFRPFRR